MGQPRCRYLSVLLLATLLGCDNPTPPPARSLDRDALQELFTRIDRLNNLAGWLRAGGEWR